MASVVAAAPVMGRGQPTHAKDAQDGVSQVARQVAKPGRA